MNRQTLRALSRKAGPMLLRITRVLLPALVRNDSRTSIAVLKIVGMGDTVLMLSVLNQMKRTFPDRKITAIVTPATRPLLGASPDVDEIILYDLLGADKGIMGFLRLLAKIGRRKFGAFLDFEQNIQLTPILSAVSGAEIRIGLRHPDHDRGRLFTHPVAYDEKEKILRLYHRIYQNLCGALGTQSRPFQDLFDYTIPVAPETAAKMRSWRSNLLAEGDVLVGMHPGSGGTNVYRRWPQERFTELIRRLLEKGNYRVVLTGGPDEKALVEEIRDSMDSPRVTSAAGFSFKEFTALLGSLDCYLSNDTGPLHIGPWMGTPTIGMFGPESPIRYGSLHANSVSLYKAFACSPCIQVHKGINPACTFADKGACVKEISVGEVFMHITAMAEKRAAERSSMGSLVSLHERRDT